MGTAESVVSVVRTSRTFRAPTLSCTARREGLPAEGRWSSSGIARLSAWGDTGSLELRGDVSHHRGATLARRRIRDSHDRMWWFWNFCVHLEAMTYVKPNNEGNRGCIGICSAMMTNILRSLTVCLSDVPMMQRKYIAQYSSLLFATLLNSFGSQCDWYIWMCPDLLESDGVVIWSIFF